MLLNLEGELGGYRQQELTGTETSARTSACVEKLELQLMDCWRLSVDKIENLKLSGWAGRHSLREFPALLCVSAPGALLGSQRDQRKFCSASSGPRSPFRKSGRVFYGVGWKGDLSGGC